MQNRDCRLVCVLEIYCLSNNNFKINKAAFILSFVFAVDRVFVCVCVCVWNPAPSQALFHKQPRFSVPSVWKWVHSVRADITFIFIVSYSGYCFISISWLPVKCQNTTKCQPQFTRVQVYGIWLLVLSQLWHKEANVYRDLKRKEAANPDIGAFSNNDRLVFCLGKKMTPTAETAVASAAGVTHYHKISIVVTVLVFVP